MIILESGINHFGKIRLAKKILQYFLKSNFKHLTFMIQTKKFYEKFKKNNLDFELPKKFYIQALKLAKKKNKKIGLAVCDEKTFVNYIDINFDFYKLLSISITNKKIINLLKNKNKDIYLSLGKGNKKNIKKCLSYFSPKKNIKLIYTSISYENNDINLNKIKELKKEYSLQVGYGHHHNNSLPVYLSTLFSPDFYFIYLKPEHKHNRVYPDDDHAYYLNELENLRNNIILSNEILNKNNKNQKIKKIIDVKKIRL